MNSLPTESIERMDPMSSASSSPAPQQQPESINAQQQATLRHLTGRDRGFWASRWYSFSAAVAGALHTIRTQPNAWIEITAIAVVTGVGLLVGVDRWEWVALVLIFSMIIALEAVNTAIEAAVDLVSPEYHPLAKIAKDAAAGALLLAVLGSVIIAAIIFLPRFWALLS